MNVECRDCGRTIPEVEATWYRKNPAGVSRWAYWERDRVVCEDCLEAYLRRRNMRFAIGVVIAVALIGAAIALIAFRPS